MKLWFLWYKNEQSDADPEACLVGTFDSKKAAERAILTVLNSYKLRVRVEEKQFWIHNDEINRVEMHFHWNDSPAAEGDSEDPCEFEFVGIHR